MAIEPTGEQTAVIDSDHRHLVVRASAGSGKTRVLVDRYLRLVERDRISPDNILAITFTKKAAAEMKSRIVGALRSRGRLDQAQIAETGPIQTFHSFCERILRENSISAGLDPQFDIQSVGATARMRHAAVDAALSDPSDNPWVARIARELAGQRTWNSTAPHSKLLEQVGNLVGSLRSSDKTIDDWEALYQDPESVLEHWRTTILASLSDEHREAFEHADPTLDWAARLISVLGNERPGWLKQDTDSQDCAELTCGLVQLAVRAWRSLDHWIERDQTLDFTELERRAVRLLQDFKPVRERIQRQYQVVLVDESQDLSPLQHLLLDAISPAQIMFVGDEQQSIYGFRDADLDLFVSRAEHPTAQPLKLSRNWRSSAGILSFVDRVFLNLWADRRYRPMADQKEFDPDSPEAPASLEGVELWMQAERDTLGTARMVRDLLEEAPLVHAPNEEPRTCGPADVCVLVRNADYGFNLAGHLEALGIASRIVGGSEKFYTRLEVRDVANALRALSDPYDSFSLLAVLRSPFVGISLDSIVLLASEEPVYDRLADFESPVPEDRAELDRFLGWFEPLRAQADRIPAWEVISELFSQTPFLERLAEGQRAEQRIANVRKLLALASEQPELGPHEYAESLSDFQMFRHREGEAPIDDESDPVVTIMTIHKAKGLEFPVAVVPETHRTPFGPSPLETDRQLAMAVFKSEQHLKCIPYEWLAFRKRVRESEEEERVLYVALTRARRRLCVAAHPNADAKTFASRIWRCIKTSDPTGVPPGVKVRE